MRSRESWRTSLPATASRRVEPFHAARSGCAASPRSLRRGDEHVLERGADLLDARHPGCRPRAPRAAALPGRGVPRGSSTRRRLPSWAMLRTSATPASARRAAAKSTSPISMTTASMSRASIFGLAFGGDAAAVEDREPVTALGLVHVVGGHQDRRAARDQREQALPEVTPALRVHGARRLVEQQQLRLVQRRRAEREPLALPARERAGALPRDALEVVALQAVGDRARGAARGRARKRAHMNSRFSSTVRSSQSEKRCVM